MPKLNLNFKKILQILGGVAIITSLTFLAYKAYQTIQQYIKTNQDLNSQLTTLNQEYETLKNEDQRKKNLELNETNNQIKSTYRSSVAV